MSGLIVTNALLAMILVGVWAAASALIDAARALKLIAAIANRAEDRELVRSSMVAAEREDPDER